MLAEIDMKEDEVLNRNRCRVFRFCCVYASFAVVPTVMGRPIPLLYCYLLLFLTFSLFFFPSREGYSRNGNEESSHSPGVIEKTKTAERQATPRSCRRHGLAAKRIFWSLGVSVCDSTRFEREKQERH